MLGINLSRNENGFSCDFHIIDATNNVVKLESTKNTGNFTLGDMAQFILTYIMMKKPNQIVIDKAGFGRELQEKVEETINNCLDVAIKSNGELFYKK